MATKQESVVSQENNYYDEVAEILSSQYITIGPVLKFLPERRFMPLYRMQLCEIINEYENNAGQGGIGM